MKNIPKICANCIYYKAGYCCNEVGLFNAEKVSEDFSCEEVIIMI